MRPLLITDGAHLKGTYKGTNLVLVGMDGNNQIIPIATGVSQGETGESWTWFLLKLKECIGEVPNLAIITDRHPAIILACNTVFPNAFHRYCCRHLMTNCKMRNDKVHAIYWKTCKAYTQEEFQRRVFSLRGFRPEAYKKLKEAGFETWSRAMCPANQNNYMTSNSAESINNLTRRVRKAPITQLMEWYRALLQKWYCARREKYKDSTVDDCRRVHKVDLTTRSCTCRKWQLSGIPCGHVIAVGRNMGCTDCSELALCWFRRTTLYSTYQYLVYPMAEPLTWQCPDGLQVVKPPNMNFRTAGKPKNTDRIKSQGEEPIQVRCSRCGVRGHTRTSCHEPISNHQEYEAAYTNNYVRSQEYEASYISNNYVRSQEYEAAYIFNNYVRSQEYEANYTNNYAMSQKYREAYNSMGSQEYGAAYNNMDGRSQDPNPTMSNLFSQFNLGQSSQQTYST
ncbi:transposase, MuDR, MULE transposase domain protein [Tanacetum coccineum]